MSMCSFTTCDKYFVIYTDGEPREKGSEQMCPHGFTYGCIYVVIYPTVDTKTTLKLLISSGL